MQHNYLAQKPFWLAAIRLASLNVMTITLPSARRISLSQKQFLHPKIVPQEV
jgi:hypothetical protein